jgi:hypothetical protein
LPTRRHSIIRTANQRIIRTANQRIRPCVRNLTMTDRQTQHISRSLGTLFRFGALGSLSDRELLECVLARPGSESEEAFRVLVERHGPMVLGLCRSLIKDAHDAEDAFQATFLVLARKASSIRRRDTIGPWLYGVAGRVARRPAPGRHDSTDWNGRSPLT